MYCVLPLSPPLSPPPHTVEVPDSSEDEHHEEDALAGEKSNQHSMRIFHINMREPHYVVIFLICCPNCWCLMNLLGSWACLFSTFLLVTDTLTLTPSLALGDS